jgi:pyrroloquinoline quinone biosynthesis protein E
MEDSPYYLHPPGLLGRGAVLDLGLKCAHSCKFCYYSFFGATGDQFGGIRKASFQSTEHCQKIVELFAENGFRNFDVTGGEPCLHPGLADIIRTATRLGLASRIITLGQFLTASRPGARPLLDALLDAGTTSFLFSLHAATSEKFKEYTGGDLSKLTGAMDALDAAGFEYCVNTVVFEGNYRDLPAIAETAAQRGVYNHNFILFNAYHQWDKLKRSGALQPRFAAVAPYLSRAVSILESARVAVNVRYAPYCVFPGLEKHIVGALALQYDPHEWRNPAGRFDAPIEERAGALPVAQGGIRARFELTRREEILPGGRLVAARRGEGFNVFAPQCLACAALTMCDGCDPGYYAARGDVELAPYAEFPAVFPLPAARREYRPAFVVKTAQNARVKKFLAGLFPPGAGTAPAQPIEATSNPRSHGAGVLEVRPKPARSVS